MLNFASKYNVYTQLDSAFLILMLVYNL